MARKCLLERNKKRTKLEVRYRAKREALSAKVHDLSLSPEERMEAVIKLASLPRNASKVRLHNRCEMTGRPRGVYRKFKLCRIKLRDLASEGQIPGMLKSSW